MRVTPQQIKAFIDAISHYILANEKVELRLFGSRMDDNLKGGDIDLLLLTYSEVQRQKLSIHKANILAKIYMQIDEEKIDLTIANINSKEKDAFVATNHEKSLLLHCWPITQEDG